MVNPLANFQLLDTTRGDRLLDLAAVTAIIEGGTTAQQDAFAGEVAQVIANAGYSGKFTSPALTTAANAQATFTIPVAGMVATDVVTASLANGTNAAGLFAIITVTPGTDELVVVARNIGGVTADGTMVVSYIIAPAAA